MGSDGTYFAVGKEGAKNVYRSLSTVEIEQALQEITLQREIDEAAAALKKSYLRAQSARLNKQALEQVAAAHKGAADAEQQTEQAPEAPKKAPKKGTKKAPKKGTKKGSKKQVTEQQTEAKEQLKEQQVEQVAEPAPEAAKEA